MKYEKHMRKFYLEYLLIRIKNTFFYENEMRHFCKFHLKNLNHNNSLQIPPLPKIFGIFKGGGSVQNPDPSGAWGGLFEKMDLTFHNTLYRLFKVTVCRQ